MPMGLKPARRSGTTMRDRKRLATNGRQRPEDKLNGSMPAPKGTTKNQGTPLGDFADFLRWRLKNRFRGDRGAMVDALKEHGVKADEESVRKWEQGANGPKLAKLSLVAKALGYDDWTDLALAIRRFKQR